MDEREWQECGDPEKMLWLLRARASDRKLRLFAVACCRRVWPLLHDGKSRTAVEVGERWADRDASEQERRRAAEEARRADASWHAGQEFPTEHTEPAVAAAYFAVELNSPPDSPTAEWGIAAETAGESLAAATRERHTGTDAWVLDAGEKLAQATLLRDIFGPLPFRPISLNPAWLTWQGGTIPRLARTLYDERHLPSGHLDTGRLAVLADALEEAGCTDGEILNHLRGVGPHTRGCWPLDALLGKM